MWVTSLSFSPDGTRIVSGSNDSTIRLWDTSTGEELTKFQAHTGIVNSVSFSPDGMRIASGGRNTICLWDSSAGKKLQTLKARIGSVSSLSLARTECVSLREVMTEQFVCGMWPPAINSGNF